MVLGLCFHNKCLMAQRNQFLQFESRILTGTEIKCLQLGREPLAFVYTLSTFMPILWAVNSCCSQIMSHYGLYSVNFQHTHPSRFTGGCGPLHQMSIYLSAEQQINMPMQMPAMSWLLLPYIHPREIDIDNRRSTGCSNHSCPDSVMD